MANRPPHCGARSCRDVNELRLRIDETSDQPWTGDAVDLRPFARHPFARRSPDRPVGRKAIVDPIGDPALQVTCINARGAQSGGDALADLMAMNAVNDDEPSAGQLGSPLFHLVRVTVKGRHDERLCRSEIGRTPNIHNHGCRRSAKAIIKISRRDRRKSLCHDNPPRGWCAGRQIVATAASS